MHTYFLTPLSVCLLATIAVAQPAAITMKDKLEPANVEVKSAMSGKLQVAVKPGQPAETIAVDGASTLIYDERTLIPDEEKTDKLIRLYRSAEIRRTVNKEEQGATLRESVRRLVILRNAQGKKSPFSPDGPLTFNEIDLVKHDTYTPTVVTGLLPPNDVKPGERWQATTGAVLELTDFDSIIEGGIAVEYISTVTLDKKEFAKLTLSGTISGRNEDGPTRQRIDGSAYFDIAASRLTYLKINGVLEMLDDKGAVTGRIDGTFTLKRAALDKQGTIGEDSLKGIELKPNAVNSLLLYDNTDLGVKFLYPRRWRVSNVQGRQITIEESKGGGILMTLEPKDRVPTAKQYQTEVMTFLAKNLAKVAPPEAPTHVDKLDRFGFDVETKTGRNRLEYAILNTAEGGVLVAARFPEKEATDLKADLARMLKQLEITKRIEVK